MFHGHVTCHVFDVHQTPERLAHIHVLQGKRFTGHRPGPRPLAAALRRQMSNSLSFIFGNCREQTRALEMSVTGAFSMSFLFSTSIYTLPFGVWGGGGGGGNDNRYKHSF